jgi:hypothetical protein
MWAITDLAKRVAADGTEGYDYQGALYHLVSKAVKEIVTGLLPEAEQAALIGSDARHLLEGLGAQEYRASREVDKKQLL